MQARIVNVMLGIWLFASAYLWPHSPAQFVNALVVGTLCVVFALLGLAVPRARHLNTALSLWLLVSVFALPRVSDGTAWHNAVVAALILMFSLVGYQLAPVRRPARQTP